MIEQSFLQLWHLVRCFSLVFHELSAFIPLQNGLSHKLEGYSHLMRVASDFSGVGYEEKFMNIIPYFVHQSALSLIVVDFYLKGSAFVVTVIWYFDYFSVMEDLNLF